MKLKPPVENDRHAFCAHGCHASFYLRRCLVCEERLPEKSRRQVWNRPKCKAAYRASRGRYKWPETTQMVGSGSCKVDARSARKSGIKNAHKDARPLHLLAGPEPTTSQFHCATVSDGPDCQGGEYERIETRNKSALRKHFAQHDCLIQPHHPPVNILGGYRFPDAPDIDAAATGTMTIDQQTRLADLLKQNPADLTIPAFLRRAA